MACALTPALTRSIGAVIQFLQSTPRKAKSRDTSSIALNPNAALYNRSTYTRDEISAALVPDTLTDEELTAALRCGVKRGLYLYDAATAGYFLNASWYISFAPENIPAFLPYFGGYTPDPLVVGTSYLPPGYCGPSMTTKYNLLTRSQGNMSGLSVITNSNPGMIGKGYTTTGTVISVKPGECLSIRESQGPLLGSMGPMANSSLADNIGLPQMLGALGMNSYQ